MEEKGSFPTLSWRYPIICRRDQEKKQHEEVTLITNIVMGRVGLYCAEEMETYSVII